jgi:Na+-driven multidrug efflux pump
MQAIMRYISQMNLVLWVAGIFAAHLLLYLLLGTANWVWTALMATVVWAIVLTIARVASRKWIDEQDSEKSR